MELLEEANHLILVFKEEIIFNCTYGSSRGEVPFKCKSNIPPPNSSFNSGEGSKRGRLPCANRFGTEFDIVALKKVSEGVLWLANV